MNENVRGEVVAPCESFGARIARIRSLPRVLARVPSELIRAGKSPVAPFPRADKRLLARVSAGVRLEVRRLCVRLVTAIEIAHVRACLFSFFALRFLLQLDSFAEYHVALAALRRRCNRLLHVIVRLTDAVA